MSPNTAIKDRSKLEADVADFLANGGVIKETPYMEDTYTRARFLRQALYYSANHAYHAKKTGISVQRLRIISKQPERATGEESKTLIDYFIERGERFNRD